MNNTPAFPVFPDTSTGHASAFRGMTLRDYFAAKAMQGMFASGLLPQNVTNEELAIEAYRMADAMMKARDA